MFDRFVIVDWSANGRPKRGRDSIWVAVLDAAAGNGHGEPLVVNPSTRARAERLLHDVLAERPGATTLVGVDFSLGFPAGTAAALGLGGTPWTAMWDLIDERIVDDASNVNNRFAVAGSFNATMTGGPAPFWGCPPSACTADLGPTKPREPGPVGEWRTVETVLRSAGHRPFSSWQLLGAGAVGSQSLVGIPVVRRLVAGLGDRASVWPFTTGLAAPGVEPGAVTFVEVWPSLFPLEPAVHDMRDAVQVTAVARRLAALDRVGGLAAWFIPDIATDIATDVGTVGRDAVVGEEGWVLGAMFDVAVV